MEHIDLHALEGLEALSCEACPDPVAEVVGLFLESLPQYRQSRASLVMQAHGLKTAARNVGARRLANLCYQMEMRDVRQGDQDFWRLFDTELTAVEFELGQLLRSRALVDPSKPGRTAAPR